MKRWPLAVAFLAALALAAPAAAAAPNYILVSGPGLKRPVLLDDWSENLRLMTSLVDARKLSYAAIRMRPRLDLAEFWDWRDKPRPTRPRDANGHSNFYPAFGSRPAAFLAYGTHPVVAPKQALRILARHGVPIRLRSRG